MVKTVANPCVRVTVRTKRLPGKDVGHAYPRTGRIYIDPRQTEREYLATLCHEWLHCAFPRLQHRSLNRLEVSLSETLRNMGYRRQIKSKP